MSDSFVSPEYLPFVAALALMIMIGIVEAMGLGASAAHLDIDADVHGEAPDLLGWLGIGQVPLLMLIVVLLALFGLAGLAVQQIAEGVSGDPLSPWVAAPAALLASLPLLGWCARGLARIMPRDETTAIGLDALLGKRATVTIGTARRGSPARARVRDLHGQVHYVMMEPNEDGGAIDAGESALLVRRDGDIFIGLPDGDALLPRLDERPSLNR